jgi:hypothetical protein
MMFLARNIVRIRKAHPKWGRTDVMALARLRSIWQAITWKPASFFKKLKMKRKMARIKTTR